MIFRSVTFIAILTVHLSITVHLAESQQQKFKIGGGAGLAILSNPAVDHGKTAAIGGFLGYRFSNNFSLETGFHFGRPNRVYNSDGIALDNTPDIPAFRYQANQYNLDLSTVFHLGRRQPFHPFIYGGAGIMRRDETRTDITTSIDEVTNQTIIESQEIVKDSSTYTPTGHIGIGAEIYFFHNLSARIESKLWVPRRWDNRTFMLLFTASYYF